MLQKAPPVGPCTQRLETHSPLVWQEAPKGLVPGCDEGGGAVPPLLGGGGLFSGGQLLPGAPPPLEPPHPKGVRSVSTI